MFGYMYVEVNTEKSFDLWEVQSRSVYVHDILWSEYVSFRAMVRREKIEMVK